MSIQIDQRGPDVGRDQLERICRELGYDPTDVRSIELHGSGPVVVEAFLRLPYPESGRGVRFQSDPGEGYAFARVTHQIGNRKHANQEES